MNAASLRWGGRRWAVLFIAMLVAAALAWSRFTGTPDPALVQRQAVDAQQPSPALAGPTPTVNADQPSKASVKATAAALGDLVGNAPDLKRVFDEHILSDDPRRRRAAAQAFAACVPAFLASSGETPSPEPLIRALPPTLRPEREAAYRALFARCHALVGQSKATLIEWQQRLQADLALRQPGAQAQEDLIAGRGDRIESLIAQALAAADPAALASLAGLAERLVQLRQPDDTDPAALAQARAVDAALPLVACDVGLSCDANSLGALQLCAAQGVCDGDLATRLRSRASADGLDLAAVEAQRARLLALIRSGRALGTMDLLP